MNTPEIYLIEPYNAYAPKRKKHWMEEVEEQALLAKIIAEQQAQQKAIAEAKNASLPPNAPPVSAQTLAQSMADSSNNSSGNTAVGGAAGGGGTPVWDFFSNADAVNFDRSPATGAGPLTVTFTNLTTTPQFDTYNWYFTIDGVTTTSTDVNPVVLFQTGSSNPTVITASLQVTNSVSGNPSGKSPDVYTLVSYPTVTSAFTFATSSNIAPFNATFTNGSSTDNGQPLTYRWTFTYDNGTVTSSSVSTLLTPPVQIVNSGSFTASLQATGSYGIASIYTQSFSAPAPTLNISFAVASSSNYSPSLVTLTPTIIYNGAGTLSGLWGSGEWAEGGGEYTLPTITTWADRLYDTRSGVATTDGKFTASLQVTESIYSGSAFYTQSFALLFPTLEVTLAVASSSNYSPSVVTLTPTITNNGAGTVSGKYFYGEFTEADAEHWSPYAAGPDVRTYDTRSGVDSTGSFTASLQLTGSNYGVTAFVTQSIPLLFPSIVASFTTTSFGFGGVENSYMEPVTMSYTSAVVYNGNGTPTYLWDFGSASFFNEGLGTQTGTETTVGPHTRADYGVGGFTASLQATGSYDVASLYTQSFTVST